MWMYSSTRSSLQRRECSTSRPDRFILGKGSRCPLHTRLCCLGQFGLESNISSAGLRTPDRPALSWSLNRLQCLGWAQTELLLSVNCGTVWNTESKERLIKAIYCTSDNVICIGTSANSICNVNNAQLLYTPFFCCCICCCPEVTAPWWRLCRGQLLLSVPAETQLDWRPRLAR
jgi:hypothetical protein